MITVKRQTGVVGVVMKLDVYINGDKVDRLKNSEVASYDLPTESAELRVGFDFLKSHPITISDGQTALAKGNIWGAFFWFFGLKSSYLVIEE